MITKYSNIVETKTLNKKIKVYLFKIQNETKYTKV